MIDSDKRYDVIGGVAGAALGLLRLFRDDPTSSCSTARSGAANTC